MLNQINGLQYLPKWFQKTTKLTLFGNESPMGLCVTQGLWLVSANLVSSLQLLICRIFRCEGFLFKFHLCNVIEDSLISMRLKFDSSVTLLSVS